LRALPLSEQVVVLDHVERMRSITANMLAAADYGSRSAHRLSAFAFRQTDLIDETADLATNMPAIAAIDAYTRTANRSAEVALSLISANKSIASPSEPPTIDTTAISADPLEASREYQRLIDGTK
jgi:hypothetical protein